MDMEHQQIIDALARNKEVFKELLAGVEKNCYKWRPTPDQWNLLEIVCHLRDEEQEDFRVRTRRVLEGTEGPLPAIDPASWVQERSYKDQNYGEVLLDFLQEREASIHWLNSLTDPQWKNFYNHPKLGPMTAELFLSNWLAHDYLHVRQILKLKFDYLGQMTEIDLGYAGNW